MTFDPTTYDDLFDPADQEATDFHKWIDSKKSVFEEKMVKTVMTKLGLMSQLSSVMSDVKDWGGKEAKISFTWFHDRWPSFPVRLCTERTVYAHKIDVTDLYKRFTSTTMYKAFMDAKELIPDSELYSSWGLIFPWSGMGYAVLHNSNFIPGGTRFVKEIRGQMIYLDQFNEFISEIGKVWAP